MLTKMCSGIVEKTQCLWLFMSSAGVYLSLNMLVVISDP